MTKLEKDTILPPRNPKLFKRFVGDIFTRCKTNVPDQLLEFFHNYNPNIKLSFQKKSLDTKVCYNNSLITIKVQ